jgi:hypothetical protein
MRMFIALSAIFVGSGAAITLYFAGSFSLGAWIAGLSLFIFAWIGRLTVQAESQKALDPK